MAETNNEKSRDEEFYYLLTEGSEHLQGGRIDEARVHFERALQIHPTNEQALNLLGLSLFRLGQLDRARQIFNDLVHGNPIEPSLRLNLAMVFLKQGRLEDAHKELQHVLELNPDHPRASSYMGLVLEKKGQLERAADYYERAGNKKRADEIRAFTPTKTGTFPIANLAAMGVQQVPAPAAPGPAAMRAASAPPASAPPATTTTPPMTTPPSPPPAPPAHVPPAQPPSATSTMPAVKPATITMGAVQVTAQGPVVAARPTTPPSTTTATAATMPPTPASLAPTPAARSVEQAETGRAAALNEPDPRRAAVTRALPATTPPASPSPSAPPAPAPPATKPDAGVTELTLADLPGRALDGRALTRSDEGHLTFPVVDNGYVRSDLLTGLSGALEVEVVHRRYRGKRTDSLFGGVDAAVISLAGKGFALLSLGELLATSLQVTSEELYLVESAVVGFSRGLVWENGRLPSEADRDLDIVHLRGTGNVVLGTKRPVVAFAVNKDAPCVVHAARLVGWSGQLLPFRAPLPGLPEAARRVPVVRFEGTGLVLAV